MSYMNIFNPEQVAAYISNQLDPNIKLKKSKGEVFTPLSVVSKILSKLPKHVWTNPTYTWLDPAAGIGNYPILIYSNLMKGLSTWEPDEEKRRKHILENMLYMVEISPTSCSKLKEFLCGSTYDLHISTKSFLDYPIDHKFDVIIGNPPYNEGGTGRTNGSRQPFWPKFIDHSLRMINDKGYISFIHPVGWRKPYNTTMQTNIGKCLPQYVKNGTLLYIHMNDINIPYFPDVDYYVYQHGCNSLSTIESSYNQVKGIYMKVNLRSFITEEMSVLPSFFNRLSHSICTKIFTLHNDNERYNIIYDGLFKPNKSMKSRDKVGIPYTFIYKDGTYEEIYDKGRYEYQMNKLQKLKNNTYKSKIKDKGDLLDYYHKPKIIMSFNGSQPLSTLNPVYYDKIIGSSNMTMYLPVKDKNESIKHCAFFSSDLLTFLLKITQYSPPPRNKNDHKLLNHIQIPNLPDNPTNNDIYKYYKITTQERELISRIIGLDT